MACGDARLLFIVFLLLVGIGVVVGHDIIIIIMEKCKVWDPMTGLSWWGRLQVFFLHENA